MIKATGDLIIGVEKVHKKKKKKTKLLTRAMVRLLVVESLIALEAVGCLA